MNLCGENPLSGLLLKHGGNARFFVVAGDPAFDGRDDVADAVAEGQKQEQRDEQHGERVGMGVDEPGMCGAACDHFPQVQHDVAAIENGQRQEVDDGEVDVQETGEPNGKNEAGFDHEPQHEQNEDRPADRARGGSRGGRRGESVQE